MDTKKMLIGIAVLSVLIVAGAYAFKNFQTKQLSEHGGTATVTDNNGNKIQVSIPPAPKFETKQEVKVTKTGFEPADITVGVGALVQWINQSGTDATVNSADHPTHQAYSPLNLGKFPDGSSVSLIFDQAGIYKYHDHLHPERTGTITVK